MREATTSRLCPNCRQEDMESTGAFLRCKACGLAITAQALARESVGVSPEAGSNDQREKLGETG